MDTTFSFNAARGFVGGAAGSKRSHRAASSRFNAARGFVGGAAMKFNVKSLKSAMFQCRTRLCGWCSTVYLSGAISRNEVSMPHAALWVVQRHNWPL